MREDSEKLLHTLQEVCRQQHEELERKRIQIWDQEEENRVLRKKAEALQEKNGRMKERIEELEAWCGHLQNCIDEEEREKEYHTSRIRELEDWTAELEKRRGGFARRMKRWICKHLRRGNAMESCITTEADRQRTTGERMNKEIGLGV